MKKIVEMTALGESLAAFGCSRGGGSRRKAPAFRFAGFTLVELLVVITIIGILIGLLLPAVQSAREAARAIQCRNQIKQIALALHAYHSAHRVFPPGAIVSDDSCTAASSTKRQAPWTVQILPFLEQNALYAQFDMAGHFAALQGDNPPEPTDSETAQNTPLAIFKCPSDSAPRGEDPSLNYMGVQGGGAESEAECLTGASVNRRVRFNNGVLHTNSRVRIADIGDGTTQTFLVGESRWWSYEHTNAGWPSWFSWASANRTAGSSSHTLVLAAAVDPINNPLVDYDARQEWVDDSGSYTNTLYLGTHTRCFGSRHPGGCHFAMADGSVQFLSENMDLAVYRDLADRDDGCPVGSWQ